MSSIKMLHFIIFIQIWFYYSFPVYKGKYVFIHVTNLDREAFTENYIIHVGYKTQFFYNINLSAI